MKEILIVPHPKLRQKSKALNKETKEDVELSKKMISIMKNAPGVGLAAIQIGVLKEQNIILLSKYINFTRFILY